MYVHTLKIPDSQCVREVAVTADNQAPDGMLAGRTTTTMMIMTDADDSNERPPVSLAEIWGVLYIPIYPSSLCLWSLTEAYNRWLKRRLVSDSLLR